jgi:hypothetical protein
MQIKITENATNTSPYANKNITKCKSKRSQNANQKDHQMEIEEITNVNDNIRKFNEYIAKCS